jgi:hypothetical protein
VAVAIGQNQRKHEEDITRYASQEKNEQRKTLISKGNSKGSIFI